MSRVSEYRKQAALMETQAVRLSPGDNRDALLQLARNYRRLAVQADLRIQIYTSPRLHL